MPRCLAVALLALVVSRGIASAECAPSASIVGDAASVAMVREQLLARGVVVDPTGDCPNVAVAIARDGDTLVVRIDPGTGHEIERTVHGVAAAATLIESYVRRDITAPLLVSRPARRLPVSVAPVAAKPRRARMDVAVGLDALSGSDESNWLGGRLDVCVRLRMLCVVSSLRYAAQVDAPQPTVISNLGPAWTWSDWARSNGEAMFGIEAPLVLGTTTIASGLSLGVGRTSIASRSSDASARNVGGRAEVHVKVSIPAWDWLAIDLSLALTLMQDATSTSMNPLGAPDDPARFVRFCVGLRRGLL